MKTPYSKRYYNHTKKLSRNKKGGTNSSQMCLFDETTNSMKGECPGVKYFNNIKDSLVIDPDAVYTVLGHSCDIIEDIQDLPRDCKYITAVGCGMSKFADLENDLWLDFLNNTLFIPISEQTLKKYGSFNIKQQKKHEYIIQASDKFVNNRTWCFVDFGHLAGLRKLGNTTPSIPKLSEVLPQIYTMRSYFLMHFEGSLYPTCEQLSIWLNHYFAKQELDSYDYYFDKDTIYYVHALRDEGIALLNYRNHEDYNNHSVKYASSFEQMIKEYFLIDLATLMIHLKGTFINNSCRTICGKFGTTNYDINAENESVKKSREREKRDINPFSSLKSQGL